MIKVFVLKCNDSVEHVVIGTQEEAEIKREELARHHYNRNEAVYRQQAINSNPKYNGELDPYRYYRRYTHWNVSWAEHTCGEGIEIIKHRVQRHD